MIDAYSLLLGLAVATVLLAWLLLFSSRWRPASGPASAAAAATAMLLDGASLATHLAFGHRPGTPDAMTLGQFLAQHPAFAVVALASAVALVLGATIARWHSGRGGPRHSAAG